MKFRVKVGEDFELDFSTDSPNERKGRGSILLVGLAIVLLGLVLIVITTGAIVFWHSGDAFLLERGSMFVLGSLERIVSFFLGGT